MAVICWWEMSGIRGVVMEIGKHDGRHCSRRNEDYGTGRCDAFEQLHQSCCGIELTGCMEFASGIPGSLGGAVVMNAGAYGGEMKDILQKVTCTDTGR